LQDAVVINVHIAGHSRAFRPPDLVAAHCDTDRQAVA
jgi:hypothetical protein